MIKECVAIIYNTIWQNVQNSSTQQTKKYKIKHKTVSVKNYILEFIIWSYTENALRKISYGHWYYTQANYKHDHGLSNYRPSEEMEVHGVQLIYISVFKSDISATIKIRFAAGGSRGNPTGQLPPVYFLLTTTFALNVYKITRETRARR